MHAGGCLCCCFVLTSRTGCRRLCGPARIDVLRPSVGRKHLSRDSNVVEVHIIASFYLYQYHRTTALLPAWYVSSSIRKSFSFAYQRIALVHAVGPVKKSQRLFLPGIQINLENRNSSRKGTQLFRVMHESGTDWEVQLLSGKEKGKKLWNFAKHPPVDQDGRKKKYVGK